MFLILCAQQPRHAVRRLADKFEKRYPAAIACLRNDLDELLTCFRYKTLAERKSDHQRHRTPIP